MKKILLFSLALMSIMCFASVSDDIDTTKYLAENNIITKRDTLAEYRLKDTITRAELTAIALKLRGISVSDNYICKNYFIDVEAGNWICGVVETAADNELISRNNQKFNPQNNISRAEALSVIFKASGLKVLDDEFFMRYMDPEFIFIPQKVNILDYIAKNGISFKPDKDKIVLFNLVDWQFATIRKGLYANIIDQTDFIRTWGTESALGTSKNKAGDYYDYNIFWFREQSPITRSEAFRFLKNAYMNKKVLSGEVTTQ